MAESIKQIIRKKKTPYRIINDECIITNLENHNIIILNDIGGIVWEELINESKYDLFLKNLKEKFDEIPADFEDKIVNILKQLEKEGFVELK